MSKEINTTSGEASGADIQKARELVEWWDTGVLPDGLLSARANDASAPWHELEGYSPRQAEREFVDAMVRSIASASPLPDMTGELVEALAELLNHFAEYQPESHPAAVQGRAALLAARGAA